MCKKDREGTCEPQKRTFFNKEIIDASKLPFKFYDINGPTWRWEAGGLKGLERLNEFHRIEVVYAGLKEQTIQVRDEVLKKAEEVLERMQAFGNIEPDMVAYTAVLNCYSKASSWTERRLAAKRALISISESSCLHLFFGYFF